MLYLVSKKTSTKREPREIRGLSRNCEHGVGSADNCDNNDGRANIILSQTPAMDKERNMPLSRQKPAVAPPLLSVPFCAPCEQSIIFNE